MPSLNGQQHAAVYARVLTTDQADRGYSLPTQIEACLALARQEGLTVQDDHSFVDDYTGTSLNRPQFMTLRDLVRQRLVQAVVVHDLDRLSRKLAHQLLLSEEFEQAGVSLYVVTMPAQDKTPEAQLLTNVRGIIAEYERAKMLERTARSRIGRVQAGYVPGGKVALGYTYVKHPVKGAFYEVDQDEAALVRRIFRLYTQDGLSQEAIAALLTREGIPTPSARRPGQAARGWSQSTVSNVLTNTAYIGQLRYGKKTRVPGKSNPDRKTRWQTVPVDAQTVVEVPPILDQAIFTAAQARQRLNTKQARRNRKRDYLFVGGRLRCGQCGYAMTGEVNSNNTERYRCSRRPYQHVTAPHTQRSIQAAAIEPVVWRAVEQVLQNPNLIAAELERRREGNDTQQADLDRERQIFTKQLTLQHHLFITH